MTSSSTTLKSFTDAAAGAIAREIATLRREAQREKDVRDAEHRARLAEWDLRLAAVTDLQRQLAERLASVKDGEPGRDGVDGKDGTDGKDGKDGTSVTLADVEPMIVETLASWERPKDGQDGKSVTVEDMMPVVTEAIDRAVAALPVAKDGKDGADGRDGERGLEGAPGKLPLAKEWNDGVHYESSVVRWQGSTYQALRDTGREPPHEDWACLAAAGQDGQDGRSFVVRGTWKDGEDYKALDVVALGGAGFVARRDAPGQCPGEGWQLIASQGKRGNQGEPGRTGDKGDRGASGAPVLNVAIDEDGLLKLHNADGSIATCDLYPLLSKLT